MPWWWQMYSIFLQRKPSHPRMHILECIHTLTHMYMHIHTRSLLMCPFLPYALWLTITLTRTHAHTHTCIHSWTGQSQCALKYTIRYVKRICFRGKRAPRMEPTFQPWPVCACRTTQIWRCAVHLRQSSSIHFVQPPYNCMEPIHECHATIVLSGPYPFKKTYIQNKETLHIKSRMPQRGCKHMTLVRTY